MAATAPGSATYSLVLTGSNVASGLFALGVGGAAGASIVLNQAAPGADIIGTVGGTEYFRISIDPATGVVTFSQSLNVWHANTGSDDDTSTLTLANAADLQVVQTVTDADGDKDTASINLGAGVFQIEDDGPRATVPEYAVLSNGDGSPFEFNLDVDDTLFNNYGTDGGTVRFLASLNGTPSGLTSHGEHTTSLVATANGQSSFLSAKQLALRSTTIAPTCC